MSDVTKGRDLWRAHHHKPDTDDEQGTRTEDYGDATAGLAVGKALWHRRKAGGTFALGAEPIAPDVTPGNDAA